MRVTLSSVSKSFGREAVIHDLSHVFEPGSRTAILGPNGSGKSTLLQLVAGASIPTKGTVAHEHGGVLLEEGSVYRAISIAAPYLSLYEELSLHEVITNHMRFKPLLGAITERELASIALLDKQLAKPVRNFSSGMKQRLKLALAILSDTPLLLLDEPAGNLDRDGIAWFQQLLADHVHHRTLLVASNRQEEETVLCGASIDVQAMK